MCVPGDLLAFRRNSAAPHVVAVPLNMANPGARAPCVPSSGPVLRRQTLQGGDQNPSFALDLLYISWTKPSSLLRKSDKQSSLYVRLRQRARIPRRPVLPAEN